jgi:hypothetical protein
MGDSPQNLNAGLVQGWRGWLADRQLPVVLAIWALAWIGMFCHLYAYSTPFPWADEWELTAGATGRVPIDWNWLWHPTNEHRAPLTRLEVLWLGWLSDWDLRLAHYVNLSLLGIGALSLVLAVRTSRGQSALSDAFLPLLVLTPWQYETTLVYAYAYGLALAVLCVAFALAMTGWQLRSPAHAGLFLVLTLVVTLSGGPVGNLWAIGLCGALVRGWLDSRPRSWKITALVGASVVVAVSVALLVLTPVAPHHAGLRSHSWLTTFKASLKLSVAWLGTLLKFVWPWALVVIVLPGLYMAGRIARDLWTIRRARDTARPRLARWLDLLIVLGTCVSVAVMIGYGRGRMPNLWHPRYCTLVLPIGLVLYLMLVRLRASEFLPGMLAFAMAVAYGWSWPEVIEYSRLWTRGKPRLWHDLCAGEKPLSLLAKDEAWAVGYDCNSDKLLLHWLQLRNARLLTFAKNRQQEPVPGLGLPQVVEAWQGRLTGDVRVARDACAAGGHDSSDPDDAGRVVETVPVADGRAEAAYGIYVPADGTYELCPRIFVPGPAYYLTVGVDHASPEKRYLPQWPNYYTYNHEPILLDLSAGKHQLTITFGGAGTRLDLLELIPRKRDLSGAIALHATP